MYFCLRFKNMLQRIQTLYLFIAAIISGGIIFFAPLWENVGGNEFYILDLIKEMGDFIEKNMNKIKISSHSGTVSLSHKNLIIPIGI